jgi:uncharacterized protein YvpB
MTPAARVPPLGVLRIEAAGMATRRYALSDYVRTGTLDRDVLASAVAGDVRATKTVQRGRATVTLARDIQGALRRVRRVETGGGVVRVSSRSVAAQVPAPVIGQVLRNDCEAAALSILLATQGVKVGQLALQAAFPRSGPPDPVTGPDGTRWGDPSRGYVGRADGGGEAGGFGVYPGPVAAVAERRGGTALDDLTGKPTAEVYRRLRAGKAVMAWVGLSDGPYGSWTAPSGRPVRVNFGEHTVVLHGITRSGGLLVSNPLDGTRVTWTQAEFELLYDRLGHRALATR